MRAWAKETGSPPRSWEWCPGSARNAGLMGEKESKWEREHPRWPGNTTVYRYFRSWADALEAADLQPFVRYEHDLPLAERVLRAQAMSAAGASASEIMAEIGVSRVTVYKYRKAHLCPQCAGPVVGDGELCHRCATRRGNPKRWSAQELLAAIMAWEELEGRPPTIVAGGPVETANATAGSASSLAGRPQALRRSCSATGPP